MQSRSTAEPPPTFTTRAKMCGAGSCRRDYPLQTPARRAATSKAKTHGVVCQLVSESVAGEPNTCASSGRKDSARCRRVAPTPGRGQFGTVHNPHIRQLVLPGSGIGR
jgi:hypothetical protein